MDQLFVHGGRGPGLCPGVNFRRTRPWIKATGEWRAEGSSLDRNFAESACATIPLGKIEDRRVTEWDSFSEDLQGSCLHFSLKSGKV